MIQKALTKVMTHEKAVITDWCSRNAVQMQNALQAVTELQDRAGHMEGELQESQEQLTVRIPTMSPTTAVQVKHSTHQTASTPRAVNQLSCGSNAPPLCISSGGYLQSQIHCGQATPPPRLQQCSPGPTRQPPVRHRCTYGMQKAGKRLVENISELQAAVKVAANVSLAHSAVEEVGRILAQLVRAARHVQANELHLALAIVNDLRASSDLRARPRPHLRHPRPPRLHRLVV